MSTDQLPTEQAMREFLESLGSTAEAVRDTLVGMGITNGIRWDDQKCPIALAIRRRFPALDLPTAAVSVGLRTVRWHSARWAFEESVQMPKPVRECRHKTDNRHPDFQILINENAT